MLAFDPDKVTQEDIVYLFFNSKGIMISEEFYEFVDVKKVRNAAIKDDFNSMIAVGNKRMEIYDELAYRYKLSIAKIRALVN